MKKLLSGPIPILISGIVFFAALALLVSTMRTPEHYGHLIEPLVTLNLIGIGIVGALIVWNIGVLIGEYRARVLGAKLSLRLLGLFSLIAFVPVAALYILSLQSFSAQFRNFLDIRVERSLSEAAADARAALEGRTDITATERRIVEAAARAHTEYRRLFENREPLRDAFQLTLSLAAALMFLVALWAAIYTARRLTLPLRDLAAGTRALASGDYKGTVPVRAEDEFGALATLFNDMTRRIQRASRETRHARHVAEIRRTYLATLLSSMSSGVIAFDARGRLRTWNAAASEIIGIALDGREAQLLGDLGRDRPAIQPFIERVMKGAQGGGSWEAELSLAGPDGERWIMLRGAALPGLKRRGGGHVVVFDDVTTLRRAMREAAWSEVARRFAHEVRNPLTPIQLSAERIRRKFLPELPEASRPALDRLTRTIEGQVDSLSALIGAFADYARSGGPRRDPVNLNTLAEDAVELFHDRLDGVRVTLALAPEVPTVLADAGRLRQIMNNLVINAHHAVAGRADPAIEIGTRVVVEDDKEGVELTVSDNGPGFAPDMLARAFDPYVSTRERGSGLGLAIVRRIVEEHEGHIVASNRDGGGARLRMWMPAQHIAQPVAESRA